MPLFGLSEASSLKQIGACITVAPAALAASAKSALVLSMPPIVPLTASCSLPPSVANLVKVRVRS